MVGRIEPHCDRDCFGADCLDERSVHAVWLDVGSIGLLGDLPVGTALFSFRQGAQVDPILYRFSDRIIGADPAARVGTLDAVRRPDLQGTSLVDLGRCGIDLARIGDPQCFANQPKPIPTRTRGSFYKPMRVMHIITRMIVGGAQENTLFNCMDLIHLHSDQVMLLTGPTDGPEGKLLAQSNTQGLDIQIAPSLIRSIQPWSDAKALRQIKQAIAQWKPEVVHTHSAKAGLLGRAAAWSRSVPCVIHTVHGAPFHPYQSSASRWFFVRCERWAAKRCHHMISVANAMTDLLVDAQVADRSKFSTIYSGMDVEPFIRADEHRTATRDQLGIQPTDIVFGKIARLFQLKGHKYVIEAAKQVCAINPNIKFLFLGDGILRESFEAEIRSLGLSDRFVFVGLVPPDQVPRYVGAMDVLVHMSLREGLARALPQALIAGKPTISYDADGAREVVLNGETGYLLRPKEIQLLADAIEKLAADPELRTRMGLRGRALFTDQFRHETMTANVRKLYLKILSRGR
jgi:glycosyltransferase involved in cell wall biosynthesis